MRSTGPHGTGLHPVKNLTLRYLVIIIRDLLSIYQISNIEIRELIQQRIDDLGAGALRRFPLVIELTALSVTPLASPPGAFSFVQPFLKGTHMLWVITTAAITVGSVLFQLGAMSVWVAILSLAFKALAVTGGALLLVLCGWYVWRRWNT